MTEYKYEFAYIKDGKIEKFIQTKTDITPELWDKKGLLPVERVVVTQEGSIPGSEESIEILVDKVVVTLTITTLTVTIARLKEIKIQEMERYADNNMPPMYKQVYALMDNIYDKDENEAILNSVKAWTDYMIIHTDAIMALTTEEEINNYNYEV